MLGLRSQADRDQALATIRARLIGCRFELEQAIAEANQQHLAALAAKIDRGLLEVTGALLQLTVPKSGK